MVLGDRVSWWQIALLERPSAHQRKDLPLPAGQRLEHVVVLVAPQQLRNDIGVDRRASGGDPTYDCRELGDVRYPIFEQVADSLLAVLEQPDDMPGFDILGQNHDADRRMLVANANCREDAFQR